MRPHDRSEKGLTRRELVAAGGSAAALATLPAAASPAAAGGGADLAAHAARPFEVAGATFSELARGLASGRWTSRRLVELYAERIAALDRAPGGIRSIAELNPEAEAIAAQLDREREAGALRGPLHGLPIVIKDNIDTADRMKTTAGSLALADSLAARDAGLVERLRAAGAIVLGKTNLSEWANFRSTRSTSGWSGRGGQVCNPYALDRNPCGSSSGSGAAPAADLCAAAVGTETDGSITCPAAMCGLVGLKPTVGLVSRAGVIPISATQDTAGPMARTVADAATLLWALAGADPRDPASAAATAHLPADPRLPLDRTALRGARLGLARKLFGWHPAIERQMAEIVRGLERLGATVLDPVEIPHASELGEPEYEVLLYEFKQGLNGYLAALPARGQPRTLAELIAWNEAHAAREMPWFGQEIFLAAEVKGSLTDAAYREAIARCERLARAEGLDRVLAEQRLDALISPSVNPAYPTDWVHGDHFTGAATTPSAVAGYPHLTVPAGEVHGLPWGLSWLGAAWSDAKLLGYGYAFEQAFAARRPPRLLPSVVYSG